MFTNLLTLSSTKNFIMDYLRFNKFITRPKEKRQATMIGIDIFDILIY